MSNNNPHIKLEEIELSIDEFEEKVGRELSGLERELVRRLFDLYIDIMVHSENLAKTDKRLSDKLNGYVINKQKRYLEKHELEKQQQQQFDKENNKSDDDLSYL